MVSKLQGDVQSILRTLLQLTGDESPRSSPSSPRSERDGVQSLHQADRETDKIHTPAADSQHSPASVNNILVDYDSQHSAHPATEVDSDSDEASDSPISPNQEAWSHQRQQKRKKRRTRKRIAEHQLEVKHSVTLIGDSMPKLVDI